MPLTPYQEEVARLLASNRRQDSYLAGGAALHLEPNTTRYSNDLDYFHDAVERVANAFATDQQTLQQAGHTLTIDVQLPGYIRGTVGRGGAHTKVEWAHDSAWRFMPTVPHAVVGFTLHPVDLAINKLLALVGRDEPRDFVVAGHIAGVYAGGAQLRRHLRDPFTEAVVLIRECEICALALSRLGNTPGNRPVAQQPRHQNAFS